MMKLKSTVLLILGFLILNCSFCYAASESVSISPEIEYKPLENVYTVKGAFENESRGNISVGLRVFYNDGSNGGVYAGVSTTVANKDESGRVVFEFEPIALKASAASGTYSFELTSFVTKPYTVEMEYLTNPDKLKLMQELDGLSGDYYTAKLISDGKKLGVDTSIFAGLSTEGKKRAAAKLNAVKSGLENVTTADSDYVTKTNKAVDAFITNYNEFTAIEAFNDCDAAAKVEAWIKKYAEKYGITTDRASVWSYYTGSSKVSTKVCELLAKLNSVNTMSDIKNAAYEAIICTQFHYSHVSSIEGLMLTHQTDIGLAMSGYNSLTDKSSVKDGMVESGKFTYLDLRTRFNELVNAQAAIEANSGTVDPVNPGIYGNGGGGIGGAPISNVAGKLEPAQGQTENPFSDVGESHWAEKYIIDLYNKKIMNGKGNGLFEPNEKITRAEAVKVIVGAFELKGSGTIKFGDVSDRDWFVEYVSAAAENGVVQGDENLNFRPNDYVTRQDFAVMLYRAMNIGVNAQATDFTDYDDIAVYARSAVNYFSAEGVINGYPDGSFVPYGNATRAEAAKIISSILE